MAPPISGPSNANEEKKSANTGWKAPAPKMGSKAITTMEHCPLDQRLSLRSKGQLWPDTLPCTYSVSSTNLLYSSKLSVFFQLSKIVAAEQEWVTGNSRPILPIIVHPARSKAAKGCTTCTVQGLHKGSLQNKQESIWEFFPNWKPVQYKRKACEINWKIFVSSFQIEVHPPNMGLGAPASQNKYFFVYFCVFKRISVSHLETDT